MELEQEEYIRYIMKIYFYILITIHPHTTSLIRIYKTIKIHTGQLNINTHAIWQ
jgi:hypothetical protein